MKIGENGATFQSFPPNIQDTETEALCYAIDRQIEKLLKFSEVLSIWGNLDRVDPMYYDYIAACIRTPYYKSTFTDAQKLRLLKKTFTTYRYAGSVKAIEEMAQVFFSNAQFVPWYEYDGEPYHFKITTATGTSEQSKEYMEEMLKKVKAARSIIDGIEVVERPIKLEEYVVTNAMVERVMTFPYVES